MKKLIGAGFAAFLLASTSLPVSADETPDVLTQLLKTFQQSSDVAIKYEKFEGDNNNLTVSNITAEKTIPSGNSTRTSIASLRFEGIGATGSDFIPVDKGIVKNIRISFPESGGGETVFDVPETTISGLLIPVFSDVITPQKAFQTFFASVKSVNTSPFTITLTNKNILRSEGIVSSFDGTGQAGGKIKVEVKDLVIDEATFAQIDQGGSLKSMGYNSGSVGLDGEVTALATGENFSLDFAVTLRAKDMSSLTVSGSASAIPMAVLAEIQKPKRDFAPLMPQLQNITIKSFKIQLADHSLIKKALPLLAKAQGMDEASFISTTGAYAQVFLANLKSPDFTIRTISALNAFLKDPKTITIAALPNTPIKVSELTAQDIKNPAAIINLLGLTVTSND